MVECGVMSGNWPALGGVSGQRCQTARVSGHGDHDAGAAGSEACHGRTIVLLRKRGSAPEGVPLPRAPVRGQSQACAMVCLVIRPSRTVATVTQVTVTPSG